MEPGAIIDRDQHLSESAGTSPWLLNA